MIIFVGVFHLLSVIVYICFLFVFLKYFFFFVFLFQFFGIKKRLFFYFSFSPHKGFNLSLLVDLVFIKLVFVLSYVCWAVCFYRCLMCFCWSGGGVLVVFWCLSCSACSPLSSASPPLSPIMQLFLENLTNSREGFSWSLNFSHSGNSQNSSLPSGQQE